MIHWRNITQPPTPFYLTVIIFFLHHKCLNILIIRHALCQTYVVWYWWELHISCKTCVQSYCIYLTIKICLNQSYYWLCMWSIVRCTIFGTNRVALIYLSVVPLLFCTTVTLNLILLLYNNVPFDSGNLVCYLKWYPKT